MNAAASFQYQSSNRKLAPIERVPYPHADFKFRPTPRAPFCCSTFVSIAATCSDDCAFKRGPNGEPGGCYVDSDSFMHRTMVNLDAGAGGRSPFDVIREEVALINRAFTRQTGSNPAGRIPQDGARGGRDLRLHVGGDVPNRRAAELLAGAAAGWRERGGGSVWTYTHSWRSISREAFGAISVLASVEQPRQVRAARRRGYAPALVVPTFPDGKRPFEVSGTRFVPCPAETLGKTCVECRLCLGDVDLVGRGLGIAFQLHGQRHGHGLEVARQALVPLKTRRVAA